MGHSKAEKAETHKRIVTIATKRFREDGLAGVGISELMKEAGLTGGGFYKHFDSRDDLVTEAVVPASPGWIRPSAKPPPASPTRPYPNVRRRGDGGGARRPRPANGGRNTEYSGGNSENP